MTAWKVRATPSGETPRRSALCRNSCSDPSRTSADASSSDIWAPKADRAFAAASSTWRCCRTISSLPAFGVARYAAVTRRSR